MKRVLVIAAVIVAIAGGAGYYVVGVVMPKRRLQAARDEIAAWERRFADARTCLLGPKPASSKTSEALAMRELSPDPWDRGSCTPKISRLVRGEGPESGLPGVERAWADVDTAVGRAAQAFAAHVDVESPPKLDPLPAALDALDAARMTLRAAASLPVEDAAASTLPVAEVIPIVDRDGPVTALTIDTQPSAHGIVLFGTRDKGGVQVVLRPGATPAIANVQPGQLRAVPDSSWGASTSGVAAVAGAIGPDGAMTSPFELDAGKAFGTITLAAAIGTLKDGVVVFAGDQKLAIARIHDGAAKTTIVPMDNAYTAVDPAGRIALVWRDPKASHVHVLGPTGDELADDHAELDVPCLTDDRAWVPAHDMIYGIGSGARVTGPAVSGELVGCTEHAALAWDRDGRRAFYICADTCRQTTRPKAAPDHAVYALLGDRLAAIAAHDGVVGLWREDGDVTYYALPERVRLVDEMGNAPPAMALSDGKVIDAIAQGEHGYVVVRLPIVAKP